MGFKGINVRQTGDRIVFRESLKDFSGNQVTTGTTNLRIFELQSDGSLKSYDFSSNTFKTTALTTAVQAMTHQQGNNSTYNTGVWTYALTTLSGFTVGNIYIYSVDNANATPTPIEREFQFGGAEGDMIVTSSGFLEVDVEALIGNATAASRLKDLFTSAIEATVDTSTFTSTTTVFETSITTNKDLFTKQALYFVTGTNAGLTVGITTYNYSGNNKVKFTIGTTLPNAPANGDTFLVFGKAIG